MKKQTQQNWIIEQLNSKGEVTRNGALANYISRLGAIIQILESKGWKFNAHYRQTEHGKDFVYELVSKPPLNFYQLYHLMKQEENE